jgi:hypothetical protein
MSLTFPNASRSYDLTRKAIRFWGYEGAREHSFFVHEDALAKLAPDVARSEAPLLLVFDRHRDRIIDAARRVFRRGNKGSYLLIASDF